MNDDLFKGFGVEVGIKDNDFLKVTETLTRIGVFSKKNNALYQSVHCLHKQGRYVIIHFKELFGLDGKITDIDENDLARRNTIVKLLEDWELLQILNHSNMEEFAPISQIKILPYKDKDKYELISKYSIGRKK